MEEEHKERIISEIKQRIKDEYRKHKDIDWEEIAARKIYASFVEPNYPQIKTPKTHD